MVTNKIESTCYLIKAVDKNKVVVYLTDVGENTCFSADIDEVYVFDNLDEATANLNELKHNFPGYTFNLVKIKGVKNEIR